MYDKKTAKISFSSDFGKLRMIGFKISQFLTLVNIFKTKTKLILNWLFHLSTKIWLEELSFGSNFGNLRAIVSSRGMCRKGIAFVNLIPRYRKAFFFFFFHWKKGYANFAPRGWSMRNNRDRPYLHVYTYILNQEAETKRFSQCSSVRHLSTLISDEFTKLTEVCRMVPI